MKMETQSMINLAFSAIGALGGFVLKAVWDGLKELRDADSSLVEKVQKIEVLVAGQYIKREDFDRTIAALFAKLDKIDSKLDMKANRSECPSVIHQ